MHWNRNNDCKQNCKIVLVTGKLPLIGVSVYCNHVLLSD